MPPTPPQATSGMEATMNQASKTSVLPAPPPFTAPDGSQMVEVMKDRLYFASFGKPPAPARGVHYFSTDRSIVYWNFFLDFGPMNLGQTYRFCELVQEKLDHYPDARIVYYCSTHGQRKANSIFLLCAYTMMVLGYSADESFRPFQHISVPPFHDATPTTCTYDLTVLDCLKGMEKSRQLGFVSFDNFNIEEYEHFEKVESGDLSWVFPGKFVAFAGPHEAKSLDEMYPTCVPEDYVPHFLEKKVGLVIRLNKKYYDENRFKSRGIDHIDLYYPDGSCPSDDILDKFLQICESRSQDEAIAVHCKAGLGRTGTCIGAYAMKHWGFTASEVIGWMRVARPGSVIGPQQQYMEYIQERMHRAGRRASNLSNNGSGRRLKTSSIVTVASKPLTMVMPLQQSDAMEIEHEDEKTQGDYLINAKVLSPHSPQHVRKSILSTSSKSSETLKAEFAAATTSQETSRPVSGSFSLRGVARKLYSNVGK